MQGTLQRRTTEARRAASARTKEEARMCGNSILNRFLYFCTESPSLFGSFSSLLSCIEHKFDITYMPLCALKPSNLKYLKHSALLMHSPLPAPRAAPRAAPPRPALTLPRIPRRYPPPRLPAHFTSHLAESCRLPNCRSPFSTTPRPKTPEISAVEAPTDSIVDPATPASFCARLQSAPERWRFTRRFHYFSTELPYSYSFFTPFRVGSVWLASPE